MKKQTFGDCGRTVAQEQVQDLQQSSAIFSNLQLSFQWQVDHGGPWWTPWDSWRVAAVFHDVPCVAKDAESIERIESCRILQVLPLSLCQSPMLPL